MLKKVIGMVVLATLVAGCQQKEVVETSQESKNVESIIIGSKHIFVSKVMEEDRPIIISLPEGYEESEANYPVLYLTDGLQNIWHTMGSVEVLTRTGSIPPIIVVGIESTNRVRDFSPTVDVNKSESGGGPKFLTFIEDELIPYIDSAYRTHPFRILEGHSLGGLFAATALIEKPELFNAHIIMSPSFWWNKEEIIEKAEVFFKSHPQLESALFFGIGTLESSKKWGMRKELRNFIDVLEANKPTNVRYEHKEMENEGHMSSPLLSTYYGLKSIFSDMTLPDEITENYTDAGFLRHERMIVEKYGPEAKQSAENYVMLSFQLTDEENFAGAITVLERAAAAYAYDVFALKFLAKSYENNNEIAKAIETYNKAIEVSIKYKFGKEEEFQAQIARLEKG